MMRRLLVVCLGYILAIQAGYLAGCGCTPRPELRPESATVDMVCLCDSLQDSVELWRAEISRRFPGAVGVVCHGGDFGQWMLIPDRIDFLPGPFPFPYLIHEHPIPVEKEVRELQTKYPGREIVLISCNPGHYRLHISGVAYALESIWTDPDRSLIPRTENDPADVGNIFEFVTE